MGKGAASHHYSVRRTGSEFVKSKASCVTVKFKNLVEVAGTVRNLTTSRAFSYLKNVLQHKECVPFKKFNRGIGRCTQAKQFKTTKGRWPKNAVKCVMDLLKNAAANCEYFGKDPADFVIHHIQVSQAPVTSRRTYRAHGRITPYIRHNSHVQMILLEKS